MDSSIFSWALGSSNFNFLCAWQTVETESLLKPILSAEEIPGELSFKCYAFSYLELELIFSISLFAWLLQESLYLNCFYHYNCDAIVHDILWICFNDIFRHCNLCAAAIACRWWVFLSCACLAHTQFCFHFFFFLNFGGSNREGIVVILRFITAINLLNFADFWTSSWLANFQVWDGMSMFWSVSM